MNKDELTKNVKVQALLDYVHTPAKTADIAKKYAVSIPVLCSWVNEEGIPRRQRGRRRSAQPSLQVQKILAHAQLHGFSNAARHFNTSRQFVSSLAKRWDVRPPKRTSHPKFNETPESTRIRRKATRDIVVSFRLRKDELSSLQQTLPLSVVQSTRSPHKLARAAVLEHLEKSKSLKSPN